MSVIEDIDMKWPTAPTDEGTVVFVDTTRMDGINTGSGIVGNTAGWLVGKGISWYEIAFYALDDASAVDGLVFYASADGGVNWDEFEDETVAISVSGSIVTYRPYIGFCRDLKVEYTDVTGGGAPAVWRGHQKFIRGDRARVTP